MVVVGAGFAGLYALHKLRSNGLRVRVFEAGPDVGGTWYFNRYPGARCDVESVDYCYSFSDALQREWDWSEKYATQPEILAYINWVADRLDLRRDITLNARVNSAVLDEVQLRWTVTTEAGERVTARFCVMATGPLSAAMTPPFPVWIPSPGRSTTPRPGRTNRWTSPASASPSLARDPLASNRFRSSPRPHRSCTCSSAPRITVCRRVTGR